MQLSLVAATVAPQWLAWGPIRIKRIHGWNNQAASVYMQFHQTPPLTTGPVTLAASRVPEVKSLVATANNGFDYEFPRYMELTELTFALSSTETNLTVVGAGGGLDLYMEYDTMFDVRSVDSVTGDLTTTGNSFTQWSNASVTSSKRLLRLDVIEQVGAKHFISIQTTDTIGLANTAEQNIPLLANQTKNLNFGDNGLIMLQETSAGVINVGCQVYIIDADGNGNLPLTAVPVQTANSAVCRGIVRVS